MSSTDTIFFYILLAKMHFSWFPIFTETQVPKQAKCSFSLFVLQVKLKLTHVSSARSQVLSVVLYFKQRQAKAGRHRASTKSKPFCKPMCTEEKTFPQLGLGVPAPSKILCSNTSRIWNAHAQSCGSGLCVILQFSKPLQLSLMGLLPEKDLETFSIACGTISRDEKDDWRVSWKEQGIGCSMNWLPACFGNRGLYLEELSFSCQHWRWTQGLRGKKWSGQGLYNGDI